MCDTDTGTEYIKCAGELLERPELQRLMAIANQIAAQEVNRG